MSYLRHKFTSGFRIASVVSIVASLFSFMVSSPAYAVTALSIGNGPSALDGSYLNAQSIADNLVFTSILAQATTSIDIVDPIDLSTSSFGTPHFNLSLSAPVCNISNNFIFSTQGHLNLTCTTLNLTGKISSGGATIDPARVTGSAAQVNVLGSGADIQQAIDDSSHTTAPIISVSAGQYNENLNIDRALTLGGTDAVGPGADPTAPTINGTQPVGNVITVTGSGVTLHGLHLNGVVNGGSSTPSVDGIMANNVDSFTAAHNTLDGFSGPGIDTTGSTNVVLNSNNIVLPLLIELNVAVSGSQTYGSASPVFAYTATPPAGVTFTGSLSCTTVDSGTAINGSLGAGSHTIDAASCSGLGTSDVAHYAVNYTSAANDFTVTMNYAWTGFFQPVDNTLVNVAKAGQSIPVKFSLSGYQGMNILAGTPAVVSGNTLAGTTGTDPIETYTTSVPGLTYDATSGQYTYVWKTDKAWAGSTKTLVVTLADGSIHKAVFKFTK